jgi:hypothetical protein
MDRKDSEKLMVPRAPCTTRAEFMKFPTLAGRSLGVTGGNGPKFLYKNILIIYLSLDEL